MKVLEAPPLMLLQCLDIPLNPSRDLQEIQDLEAPEAYSYPTLGNPFETLGYALKRP